MLKRAHVIAGLKGALRGAQSKHGNKPRQAQLKARLKRAQTPQARPKGRLPNSSTRSLKMNKYGLTEDPRGLHVTSKYKGRELLGEVKGLEIRSRPGGGRGISLIVVYMNGERWPFDPSPYDVKVLRRTNPARKKNDWLDDAEHSAYELGTKAARAIGRSEKEHRSRPRYWHVTWYSPMRGKRTGFVRAIEGQTRQDAIRQAKAMITNEKKPVNFIAKEAVRNPKALAKGYVIVWSDGYMSRSFATRRAAESFLKRSRRAGKIHHVTVPELQKLIKHNPAIDWNAIRRYNFTFAIPGGAWLEDASGNVHWTTFEDIKKHMGQAWLDRANRKQGFYTGTWVEVDSKKNPGLLDIASGLAVYDSLKKKKVSNPAKYEVISMGSRNDPIPDLYYRGDSLRAAEAAAIKQKGVTVIILSGDKEIAVFRNGRRINAPSNDPIIKHQLKIARDTLRMPDAMLGVMGGMTKAEARAIVKKYGSAPKKKRNPSISRLSREFQGHASGAVKELKAASSAPADLARLGRLILLQINGKTLRIPGAVACADTKERIWIAGSRTPMLNRKAKPGEVLDFGPIEKIVYLTAKSHIGNGKTFEYDHDFEQPLPHLRVDHEGMPIIYGGGYKIKAAGITG